MAMLDQCIGQRRRGSRVLDFIQRRGTAGGAKAPPIEEVIVRRDPLVGGELSGIARAGEAYLVPPPPRLGLQIAQGVGGDAARCLAAVVRLEAALGGEGFGIGVAPGRRQILARLQRVAVGTVSFNNSSLSLGVELIYNLSLLCTAIVSW